MTRLFILFAFVLMLSPTQAQDAKQLYEKGLELAQQGEPEAAIKYFDQSIALKSDEYVAWYNRGITEFMLNRYEDALADFEQTIKLSPGYKKAYLNRGTAKKHLTDYDGAMEDYNFALKLDSTYSEAYYNRGLLYNLLGKRVPACLDFERALKLGYKSAKAKMDRCVQDPTGTDTTIHAILRLTKTADNDQYGFTPEHPIKSGTGPEGGPHNSRSYLELLRDVNGKPLKYGRLGSCCPYETPHALFGKTALLDKYQITYTVAGGAEKKAIIYITFYDYEEPMILAGFRTITSR
jgi:tetratricopeptide (TPR) repeat protein